MIRKMGASSVVVKMLCKDIIYFLGITEHKAKKTDLLCGFVCGVIMCHRTEFTTTSKGENFCG